MSDDVKPGAVAWRDLTVENAEEVRDFYAAVAGWRAEPVDMGGYSDFTMFPAGESEPAGGICHARGPNAGLPAQWLLYIQVSDLDAAVAKAQAHGGELLRAPPEKRPGYAVLKDPAGAVFALWGA